MADAESQTDPDTPTNSDAPTDPDAETSGSRSVVIGSFRRAFAETDSWLLTSYVALSAVLGGLIALLLLLALPVWIFNTAGGSELATFSRAFLVVGGVLLLAVLALPVVSSGRRHARGTASWRADYLLAVSGYLFVASLYVSLLISAPPDQRGTPPDAIAPAVEFLYSLPAIYAVGPPLLAVALVAAAHRFAK
jgi:hypothetical protein